MNTTQIYENLSKVFELKQANELTKIFETTQKEFENNQIAKLVDEFKDLKSIVSELAEAQKRSENRIGRLENAVSELVEAQKRSENRIGRLENAVSELAEAQKRSENRISRLENAVSELAEAQKQTEKTVGELAEAQRQTEKELGLLAKTVKSVQKELGGLSDSVGYSLENSAYKSLPTLLKRDFNIELKEKIDRKYLHMESGELQEFNVVCKGIYNNKEIFILGESKSQLSAKHIERFLKQIKYIEDLKGKELFLIAITNSLHPDVEKFAIERGIKKVYKSSEF
jgi:chromosome segregation ATPase